MAAQTLRCSGISAAGSAPFSVSWTGLGGNEFSDEQAFRDWALSIFDGDDVLRKLLAAWYIGHDPSMSTPSLLLNARAEVDTTGGFSVVVGA